MSTEQEQDLAINSLKDNQGFMAEKLKDLKDTMVEGFADIKKDFSCFKTDCNRNYASKLTEKIVYALVAIVLIAFMGGLTFLVFK